MSAEQPTVLWIPSTSWEVPFHGLTSPIPWPAEVDPAGANADPFEMEHMVTAVERLGPDAPEPWTTFGQAALKLDELAEALEDGELGQATGLLEEIEAMRPGTSFGLYHRGYLARHDGREEEAIALYRAAAEKVPQAGAIWNAIGGLLAFRGEKDGAVAAFRRALQSKPNDPMALEGLAQLRELVKLQAQDPQHPNAVVYVDHDTFRRMTGPRIEEMAAQPDQLIAMGEQLLREGLVPDVGFLALEKARAVRPDHPQTLALLGTAYRMHGRHAESRDLFLHYTAQHPEDAAGWVHLAGAFHGLEDSDAEHNALKQALAIDPNFQPALAPYFRLTPGDHDPAKEEDLARFGELRQSWMAYLLASTLCRERGDTPAAVRQAERALAINGELEEILLHYCAVLGDARDVTKLSAVVKPRVESGKYSRRLDWNYAQTLRQLGLNTDAMAVLRKAMAAPDAPDDFKKMCATMMDAWTGAVAGAGIALEIHASGFLLRPLLISLPDGEEGGVLLNAGSQLPGEARFPWKVSGGEAAVPVQQGQATAGRPPHSLGVFRIRGIQPGTPTIDCHLMAQGDGALHFRASQGGRKLQVGWTPYTGPRKV